jgi:hydroxymethylbilane synthase
LSAPLRIATRRSKLALWQARHVAERLERVHAGIRIEIVPMTTQGDRVQDRALADVGGKGLFVKELELALAENRADLAVHSMKDVPSSLPPGFAIAAALERANPLDALVSREHRRFEDLPPRAAIGTSSPRRQAQLKAARRDLEIRLLRGNVETRLARLADGSLDAIVLACAGLERLGLAAQITQVLDAGLSVPAVGQGVIGVETRDDDTATRELAAAIDHAETRSRLEAERAFAETLHGSCHSPIAAHARIVANTLTLSGFVGAPDGAESYRGTLLGPSEDAVAIGRALARQLSSDGAGALLERLRAAGEASG